MNIYEKINEVKLTLQTASLKKSGWNDYSGYAYFELGDILPVIVSTCDKIKLHTSVSFAVDLATLTITDIEKPEDRIVVTSPMSTAKLKACHEVQNLGAVETYIRRYLYVAAFDVVEHDALDATTGKEKKTQTTQAEKEGREAQPIVNGSLAVKCTCGKVIDFGETTPEAWIKSSKKRFGKTLCMDCINKEKALAEKNAKGGNT